MSRDETSRDEIQEKAEFFNKYHSSSDPILKEKAWLMGQELLESFLPLIKSILFGGRNKIGVNYNIWHATLQNEGHEDMMSEAKVQFFEALCDYNPDTGVYFTHYIKNKMQFGIFNYLRNGQSFDAALKNVSFDQYLSDDFDKAKLGIRGRLRQSLADMSETVEEILFKEQEQTTTQQLMLKVAWNSLNERQRAVLVLLLQKNYTLREAGKQLGMHFTTVRGIKKRALIKMHKLMKKVKTTP